MRPLTCNWIGAPGSAVPLMITFPAVTAPLSNPSGSMITVALVLLLLIAATVGVAASEAASVVGAVAVTVAVVAVLAALLTLLVGVIVAVSAVSVGVSVVLALAVSLMSCATATPAVWVSSVATTMVAVSVAWTSGVSATGSAVNSATTAAGPTRPRSWAMKPVLPVDGKKAKRSPNQPRPTPMMMTKLSTAANGNSTLAAKPRRLSGMACSAVGAVARHWLLCKKALANSLALA